MDSLVYIKDSTAFHPFDFPHPPPAVTHFILRYSPERRKYSKKKKNAFEMTSIVARVGLSTMVRSIYERHGRSPRNIEDRVLFYLNYLFEVIPSGITVNRIFDPESYHNGETATRVEVRLLTASGELFMSGLVSMDVRASHLEIVAGSEAYTRWLDGYFVPDSKYWRFFTGLGEIGFFGNGAHAGEDSPEDEWGCQGRFDPIAHAQEVAAFLQQEYDRLWSHWLLEPGDDLRVI